ncbi:hypothetical protein OIE47_00400 [Micromonospora sp. NBC_01796]|nr:hypothetical protein [Micromonospora sp. NBC_01796]WSA86122.1 hypothetical protein OIE47_00400 [Micromonospora sp. NBC_01796]
MAARSRSRPRWCSASNSSTASPPPRATWASSTSPGAYPSGRTTRASTAQASAAHRRSRRSAVAAAIGTSPQSRYQGRMAGPNRTSAPRARPRAYTGPSSSRRSQSSSPAPSATASPAHRQNETACGATSAPISSSRARVARPRALLTDQFAAETGVSRAVIQPYPVPATAVTATVVPTATTAVPSSARTVRHRPASCPAQSGATNTSATRAGAFTRAARVSSAVPSAGRWATAEASPAQSSPTIRASLCAPPTRWIRTSGLSTPSQSAAAGSTPQRRARPGRTVASRTTPSTAIIRRPRTPRTTWVPVTAATAVARTRKTGPYGVVVCCQIAGTSAARGPPRVAGPCP